MLVVSRKLEETIKIDDDITITVMKIAGGNVRIGIEAPKERRILRGELEDKEKCQTPIEGTPALD